MSDINEHPMDDFPVRDLEFDYSAISGQDPLWSRTCPEFSMFINALGLHVPHFERYLVRALGTAKKHVTDDKLRSDMANIIGQEAQHAKNFIAFNRWMTQRYPKVEKLDREAAEGFQRRAKEESLKTMVSFTAGYETFTFLAGMLVLDNYEKWFVDSDAVMKALWVWHQVEEVEHGAVAFEVYEHLYGEYEWYRKWMVLKALLHIAFETLKAYSHMARIEGWLKNPFNGVKKIGFCVWMLGRFAWKSLPVFRRSYHPRRHPMVTTSQNRIQIAWRRFEKSGGDVLEIDREKMARIMDIPVAY